MIGSPPTLPIGILILAGQTAKWEVPGLYGCSPATPGERRLSQRNTKWVHKVSQRSQELQTKREVIITIDQCDCPYFGTLGIGNYSPAKNKPANVFLLPYSINHHPSTIKLLPIVRKSSILLIERYLDT